MLYTVSEKLAVIKVNHMGSMYLNFNKVESYVNYGFVAL